MGLEFLARVRRATLYVTAASAILVATYAAPLAGAAVALGAAWSLVNLFLIQVLVVTLTTPGNAAPPRARAYFALGGMAALFAAGAGLLTFCPVIWLMAGFWLPFVVLVLKAGSRIVLGTRAWRSLTRSPWRAAAAVGMLLLAAWWVVPAVLHRADAAADGRSARVAAHAAVATGHEGAEGAPAEAHESEGPEKFPNVITVLTRAFPRAGWAHGLHRYEPVLFSMLIGLLLCVVGFLASRNPKMIPGPLQNGAELVVEMLYNFVGEILGPRYGPRFFPFLGTLFIYIFAMNLFGLIPFMDSPTSNLNVTFALGLVVFIYAQWVGLRHLGVIGYFDHLLGSPRDVIGWCLAPLMLPIHVLGELAKPISLSCRLFGNIFGEDMLMVAFSTLGIGMLSFAHLPIGLPMHAIFFPLALLTSALQALVFTVLSTIYLLLMLPHDDHGHEAEAQHAHSHG